MTRVNVHDAKTHLSRYLERVANGETILLCKRNVPIAELRPVAASKREPRPVGLAKGRFQVSEEFFEPLPEALVRAFERHAERRRIPTGEWVRRAIENELAAERRGDPVAELASLNGPTADLDDMLADIEAGRAR